MYSPNVEVNTVISIQLSAVSSQLLNERCEHPLYLSYLPCKPPIV